MPGLSYNWWGFQAWDTLKDSTDNSSIDKVEPVWNDRSNSLNSKIQLMRSLVTSIFLYACESWTPTAELQRRLQAMEMRCYCKILHISQGPCYQWGSPCQDPAGNWTTRRPPGHHKETQTAVVWSCLLFNRSGQNHLVNVRHSERGKKTRQTEEEVERHQGRGQWRTGKNGGNWLWNHLWCPNDPRC